VSTTATAGQTSGSPPASTAVQGRGAGNPRRADANDPQDADLFANLLGLLAETHSELPEEAAALVTATTEEEAPDTGAALATVIDWLQTPANALATEEGEGDARASVPSRGLKGAAAEPPGDAATATNGQDRSLPQAPEDTTIDPSLQDDLPPAPAQGQGAAMRARTPAAAQRGTDRPSTLMLQNTDTVNWRSAAAARHDALPVTPSASAMAWSTARSTVALSQRFSLSQGIDGGTLRSADLPSGTGPAIVAGATAAHAGDAAMGQRHGGASADGGGLATGSDSPASEEVTETFKAEPGPETEEAQQQDMRAWTAGNLRQASLRVGQGSDEAIDIELSLRGQEVNVEFRTDNADARSTLQASAGQTLADMLQRSGMQLAGLSVGGQALSQRQSSGADPGATPSRVSDKSRPAASVADAPPTPPRPPRNDGTASIDLFV